MLPPLVEVPAVPPAAVAPPEATDVEPSVDEHPIMLATATVRERTALSCSLCRMSCSARVRSSSGKPEKRLRSLPASASSGGEPLFLSYATALSGGDGTQVEQTH
jgi:hypothetical protein